MFDRFLKEIEEYQASLEYMLVAPEEYFEESNPVVFENVISTTDFLITKRWYLAKIGEYFVPVERSSEREFNMLRLIVNKCSKVRKEVS